MGAFALGVSLLIHFLSGFIFINRHRSKEVVFVGNFTVAEKASDIKAYWDRPQQKWTFLWLLPQTTQIIIGCRRTKLK